MSFAEGTDWIVEGEFPAGDEIDAVLREILARESLDVGALYTVRDLAGEDAAELKLVLLALFFVVSEGGLCLRIDSASALVEVLQRMTPDLADLSEQARRMYEYARSSEFQTHRLVAQVGQPGRTDAEEEFRPLVYDRAGGWLYFQKHFAYKQIVAKQVSAFFAAPRALDRNHEDQDAIRDAKTIARCLRDVLIDRPVRGPDGQGLRMAAAQQMAILLGLTGAHRAGSADSSASLSDDDFSGGGFLIVTGGPGTGKTSTVLNLLRALTRSGVDPARIALAAPTGRAARRLTETLQSGIARIADPAPADLALNELRGITLHRLLRYVPARNRFAYHRANPLALDVLVVDEVSMIDAALMAHLLEALDVSRTRVIFLGDRDQLPSVDVGAVLADFLRLLAPEDRPPRYSPEILRLARDVLPEAAPEFEKLIAAAQVMAGEVARLTDRIVQLTESFRSGDAILTAASAVNSGQVAAVSDPAIFPLLSGDTRDRWPWPAKGCYRIAVDADEQQTVTREAVILDWVRENFAGEYLDLIRDSARAGSDELPALVQKIFAHLNRSRILAVTRRGMTGVSGANLIAGRWFRRRLARNSANNKNVFYPGNLAYIPGLPLLIVRNDHRRELYNGDVGVALYVRTETGRALRGFFERSGGSFVSYPIETLPAHEAAFALTVHKSQGSEYGRVLILLPDDANHRMLSREVLYTGLTRAKDLAVIYGSEAALERAVREKMIRETGGLYDFGSD